MHHRIRMGALLVAVFAIAVDQSSKEWARTALTQIGGHLPLYGPIDLTFSLNQSNAFGLTPVIGHATRWFLMSANFVVGALLIHTIMTRRLRPLMIFGLALIMAGAVGNGLDRLLTGAVVDFLDASKIGFVWVFNVADATLDVGIGLVLLSTVLSERRTTA